MFKYGIISGPYFSVFGLNTEIHVVNLCIKLEYRKIPRPEITPYLHTFHAVLGLDMDTNIVNIKVVSV